MTALRSIAVAAALLLTAGLSAAQGTPSSPAKKELVQKVLQLQQTAIDNTARVLGEQSIAPLAQQLGPVIQQRVPPEQREALTREIQGDFKKYADEVSPLLRDRAAKLAPSTIGSLLDEKFSEEELKQVVAMLEAPIYRKYHQLSGDMQRVLTEKLVAETRTAVEPKLQALQETIGKRLNSAANGGAPAASKPAAAPKAAASTPKK